MAKLDILDECDTEECQNAQDSNNAKRTYALDFGLSDPHNGSKTFVFDLQLTTFVDHQPEGAYDKFIMEFNILGSNCSEAPAGGSLSHFLDRDGDPKYSSGRSIALRDAIAATLGLQRSAEFSVKKRVQELIEMSGAESLTNDENVVFVRLSITRENYTKGARSKNPGDPGHKLVYVWSEIPLEG